MRICLNLFQILALPIIILHELCHLFAALILKVPIKRFSIYFSCNQRKYKIGGRISIVISEKIWKKIIIICLAPTLGFFLIIIFCIHYRLFLYLPVNIYFAVFIIYSLSSNTDIALCKRLYHTYGKENTFKRVLFKNTINVE